MTTGTEKTVGTWVAERLGRHAVFAHYGIDFCCGGATPLAVACRDAGHDADEVLAALAADDRAAATRVDPGTADWTRVPLAALCDHIESTHHTFMKSILPRIAQLLDKVVDAHGTHHPELADVAGVFADLRGEISDHLAKEEQVLFPLIRRMETTGEVPRAHCGSVGSPIRVMEHEHDRAGEALRRLRELTGGYEAPADGCTTYRALMADLAEMESDLHLHIHKENNILHPRARRLEEDLAARDGRKGNA